jgi:hypothetical protein
MALLCCSVTEWVAGVQAFVISMDGVGPIICYVAVCENGEQAFRHLLFRWMKSGSSFALPIMVLEQSSMLITKSRKFWHTFDLFNSLL